MKNNVYIISDAEEDLLELFEYVADYDSIVNAEKLLENIYNTCQSLSELAHRGHTPPELERIGIFEYKEIHFKPYRIIYQIIDNEIYIHCILDGRRDLQELLEQRLIR
jgi:toxin ParE1/3/4